MLIKWPEQKITEIELDLKEVLYILVSTPKDQSKLHRYLSLKSYIPVLLAESNELELWRFINSNGDRPL